MTRWTRHSLLPVSLLLLVSLAGCQTGQPPAPGPVSPPTAADPAPVVDAGPQPDKPPEGCIYEEFLVGLHGSLSDPDRHVAVRSGLCHVQIGEGAVNLSFELPGFTLNEALHGLTVIPREALKSTDMQNHRVDRLSVNLRAGKPGDKIEVRWTGETSSGPSDLGFVLERLADPRVTGWYRLGEGSWEPWTEILTLPQQPVSFRFEGTGGLTVDQVADAVRRALGKNSATLRMTSGDAVEVTLPELPPVLFIDFWGLRAPHANVRLNGFTLYAGEPPQAVWLDPATGQETVIGPVPAEIFEGYIAPDGAHALLLGYSPDSPNVTRIYVMETATGRLHPTSFQESWSDNKIFWRSDRLIFPTTGLVQIWHLGQSRQEIIPSAARFWGPVSPDGRYVPGFAVDGEREDPATLLAPATIYLFDLQTGTERAFADAVRVRVPHSSLPYYLPMAWEGERLVLGEPASERPPGGPERFDPVTLDPASGLVTPGQGTVPDVKVRGKWLSGPGGWEATPNGWWGPVTVRQNGGAEHTAGPGYVLGWEPGGRLLIIRWAVGGPKRIRESP